MLKYMTLKLYFNLSLSSNLLHSICIFTYVFLYWHKTLAMFSATILSFQVVQFVCTENELFYKCNQTRIYDEKSNFDGVFLVLSLGAWACMAGTST